MGGDTMSFPEGVRLVKHTFRWGIGNKFRSQSINRFRPVHIERLTVASIPEDYFIHNRKNVQYNEVNEHWEVFWNQNGKLNGKPFPIRKYGFQDAKRLAFEFANTVEDEKDIIQETKETIDKTEYDVGKNYYFDPMLQCWVACCYKNNRPQTYAFNVHKHGYQQAKELALCISRKERGS